MNEKIKHKAIIKYIQTMPNNSGMLVHGSKYAFEDFSLYSSNESSLGGAA